VWGVSWPDNIPPNSGTAERRDDAYWKWPPAKAKVVIWEEVEAYTKMRCGFCETDQGPTSDLVKKPVSSCKVPVLKKLRTSGLLATLCLSISNTGTSKNEGLFYVLMTLAESRRCEETLEGSGIGQSQRPRQISLQTIQFEASQQRTSLIYNGHIQESTNKLLQMKVAQTRSCSVVVWENMQWEKNKIFVSRSQQNATPLEQGGGRGLCMW
jgi:hypothetical protein